jgi:polyisoprenoid-binding protein YceI
MRNLVTLMCVLAVANSIASAHATPYTLSLSRPHSSVKFGLKAPNSPLQLDGSLSDFTGSVIFDDTQDAITHARFSMNLSSAKLPPDQLLQAIFLQTILSRVRQQRTTFESSRITHVRDSTYLVSGSYVWMDKPRYAEIPVQLVYADTSRAEIAILVDGPLKAPRSTTPEFKGLGDIPANASGWARAKLIFTPRSEPNVSTARR